jgi:hypothetical protein
MILYFFAAKVYLFLAWKAPLYSPKPQIAIGEKSGKLPRSRWHQTSPMCTESPMVAYLCTI